MLSFYFELISLALPDEKRTINILQISFILRDLVDFDIIGEELKIEFGMRKLMI